MKILFYQNPPSINSTLLTWTLCEELRLLGHQVDYRRNTDFNAKYDWVHGSGIDSKNALWYARKIGAKCHIHLEGVAYWRIGYENAIDWGYQRNHTEDEIEHFIAQYKDWMQTAYKADSCTVNGQKQVGAIEWMFGGEKLPNCNLISCGVDARYALTLPEYPKENYMITVSRLEPNKKVFMIAESIGILKQQGFDIPLWIIIGYGSQEQISHLNFICQKYNIRYVLHPCFGAEKWYWIKRARLMLAGWSGIPPEEAIACKIPCLIYNDIDIKRSFEDTVWYAETPEEYADKIEWLLDYGNGGIITDRCQYSLNRILDLYRPIMCGPLFANTQERCAKQYELIFKGGLS